MVQKGQTMGARRSSLRGGNDGAVAVVRLVGADTRPRKERRGRWIARARAREGGRDGKEKGVTVVVGRPL
jgi:hypothetical protein